MRLDKIRFISLTVLLAVIVVAVACSLLMFGSLSYQKQAFCKILTFVCSAALVIHIVKSQFQLRSLPRGCRFGILDFDGQILMVQALDYNWQVDADEPILVFLYNRKHYAIEYSSDLRQGNNDVLEILGHKQAIIHLVHYKSLSSEPLTA